MLADQPPEHTPYRSSIRCTPGFNHQIAFRICPHRPVTQVRRSDAQQPIELDELVTAVASLLGISDQPIESIAEEEDAVASVPDVAEPDPAWRIEKRMFLQRLWEELEQLPRNQRAALLLNLKETSGFGCITLFPATGVASVRQLAAAVEMTPESFAELWNDLPLEDAKIAELLGLTRQQVINARKSGRERLTRRLRGFI